MLESTMIILLFGNLFAAAAKRLKLPPLLGMLVCGIIIGPYAFNLLNLEMLAISDDLRKIALIIILLRAGLGIKSEDLKKIGPSALKMSCIPGIIEGFTIAFVSTKFFEFTFLEGGILGFVIAAVSPAVVVPQMLQLIENKLGTNKKIPTLILTGASIDDVFAITIFTTFLGLYTSSNINVIKQLIGIPLSIILGITFGVIIGLFMIKLFDKINMRDTQKVLIVLAMSIFLTILEEKSPIQIASLLGVMTIGFIIFSKHERRGKNLASKFNKIWVFAEIFLFVLVGAEVNINVALKAGLIGVLIIIIGIVSRSIGVLISTQGTNLNFKERIFCTIAYTPKATVQAAIGAIPLSIGVESGELILAMAVLSILVTAPLGAIGIKLLAPRFLAKE